MQLLWIEIKNYKSYSSAQRVEFTSGINIVVGKNNSGKSALFEAIALKVGTHPHKSLEAQPHQGDSVNPMMEFTFRLQFSGAELRQAFLSQQGAYKFAWPVGVEQGKGNATEALQRIFAVARLEASATFIKAEATTTWKHSDELPGLRGYDSVGGSARNQPCLTVKRADDHLNFTAQSYGSDQVIDDCSLVAVMLLHRKTYVFEAERRAAGHSTFGQNTILNRDCSNLAEVLMNLQGNNPEGFRQYQDLVKEVFPELRGISVAHSATTAQAVEVLIWLAPQSTERTDLTIPLEECGTGISQLLAILYVIKSSAAGAVIAIDEPNSFLHPEASRALVRILRRFPKHQYIIATHSPEIIYEASAETVTILEHKAGRTVVKQYQTPSLDTARAALHSVGARLSDVFGYDHVLWVEGASDATVFDMLIERWVETPYIIAARPVRSTSDFEKPSVAQAVDIYAQLTHAQALIPPALGFIFDREKRPETEIADAQRRTDAKIRFLPRMMMENYFLQANVLGDFLRSLRPALENAPTDEVISAWLVERRGRSSESRWKGECHGKKELIELMGHFCGALHVYRETLHLPLLCKLQLERDPSALEELRELLVELGVVMRRDT